MTTKTDPAMQDLKPTVWIGKQGCTAATIEEIAAQLKKRKVIKVKWLQNTEIDPEAVAEAARAVLVEVRGKTMVFPNAGKMGKNEPFSYRENGVFVISKYIKTSLTNKIRLLFNFKNSEDST